MYNLDAGASWHECNEKGLIPDELSHMEEDIYVSEDEDRLKGVTICNLPIGEHVHVEAVSRDKAPEVARVARAYVDDLEDEYPHELWTRLQYSLQHIITYWLRTCTLEEMEEMSEIMDAAILKFIHAATRIRFDAEQVAKDKLRLPTRL
jgi:hypothetical protein